MAKDYTTSKMFKHHKRLVKNYNANYDLKAFADTSTSFTPAENDVVLATETGTILGTSMVEGEYYRYDGSGWGVEDITTFGALKAQVESNKGLIDGLPMLSNSLELVISQGSYNLDGSTSFRLDRCRSQKITTLAGVYKVNITTGYQWYAFKSDNGLFTDLSPLYGWISDTEVLLEFPSNFLLVIRKGSVTENLTPAEFEISAYSYIELASKDFVNESLLRVNTNTTEPKFAGRIGTSGHIGRTELPFDNSTPKTFRRIFTIAQHCDYVRVGFINGKTSPYNITKASVSSLDTTNNFDCTGLSWTALSFNGKDNGVVEASKGSARRNYLVSDWVALSSLVPSDDPTKEPKIVVSAYVNTAETLTLLGKNDGSTDFTNWATHPTRPMVMRISDGDCVTTPANFTDQTNKSTSVIGFIQYVAQGQVITVFATGDSIANAEGGGITYAGQSESFLACVELSNLDGIAYDFVNLAWSGKQTDSIQNQILDILEHDVVPDICISPIASPNDQSTITDATIELQKQRSARSTLELNKYNVKQILWTWLASNNSVKPYGSTDTLRIAYNNLIRNSANKGVVVADFASVIDDPSNIVDGQVQMNALYNSDGIHTNDAGKAALVSLVKHAINHFGLELTGNLITA